MINLALSLLLSAHGFSGVSGKVLSGIADRVLVKVTRADARHDDEDSADSSDSDDDSDSDTELQVVPPVPPIPPVPPVPPVPRIHIGFSETGKSVPTAELLHRIAQRAGWSMTLVGAPKDKVDIDVHEVDPREALREVLKKSGAMGVLKDDKLVVVATPEAGSAGLFIEQTGRHSSKLRTHGHGSRDLVSVFQGDVTVKAGEIVQGDAICVGGSVFLEPGSVIQGDAVAIGGSVSLEEGALVLGEAVAVLGSVDIAKGAQVMGEHKQVGVRKLMGNSSTPHKHGFLTGLGPFGLFPTIALFAILYLIGLLALRMWPDRVRNVGFAMFENPVRSFTVGFLCWLLLLPLCILFAISIVGIPLIPLLPLMIFLSIVVGLSSFALRIGESLPAGPGQRFVPPAALGMGMTVLLLLAFVPWLGISILALLQFFALGASVSSRFGRALPPHVP